MSASHPICSIEFRRGGELPLDHGVEDRTVRVVVVEEQQVAPPEMAGTRSNQRPPPTSLEPLQRSDSREYWHSHVSVDAGIVSGTGESTTSDFGYLELEGDSDYLGDPHSEGVEEDLEPDLASLHSDKELDEQVIDVLHQIERITEGEPSLMLSDRSEIEMIVRESLKSISGNYGIVDAVRAGNGYHFPADIAVRNSELFAEAGYSLQEMTRRQHASMIHDRLNEDSI